jgi:DNA (cytosine-5)-methyltransferase 1
MAVDVNQPRVLSLFTGAGGLDLGFHAAGFRTAVAVEMDHRCCETLRANRSRAHGWAVIERRVEHVPSDELLNVAGMGVGEADLLIGGPPCQPFSKSGYWARGDSGRLADPRANTLGEYLRILRDTRPAAFLLENVSGLAYTGKEEGLKFLLDEVQRINETEGTNYVVSARVLNAAWFGVPQTRERIILVGSRDGRRFRFPEARFSEPSAVHDLVAPRETFRTAWDAIGDLDHVEPDDDTRMRGRWADLLPSIPEGQNYLHHTARGGGLPLFGWRRRYWSFLLKLAKERPSWTLTAQPGPAIGPFHWRSRRLSRQELGRLQTFPDDYEVTGTLAEAQKQIGNAVPSLLGEVLAREIAVQLLGRTPYADEPILLPPVRPNRPDPEVVAPVPKRHLASAGSHEAHPGTGLGYGAIRRKEAA